MSQTPETEEVKIAKPTNGLAVRVEMALSQFVLGYWMYGVSLLVIGLISALIYGQYVSWQFQGQQVFTSQISAAEYELYTSIQAHPKFLELVQELPEEQRAMVKREPFDPERIQLLLGAISPLDDTAKAFIIQAADKITTIGDSGSGTAAIEAWLSAGYYYRIAGEQEKALALFEKAANQADGALKYAADLAFASAKADSGDLDSAISHLQPWTTQEKEFYASDAAFEMGRFYESAGKTVEARTAYTEVSTRWGTSLQAREAEVRIAALGGAAPSPIPDAPPITTPPTGPTPEQPVVEPANSSSATPPGSGG